jgi:hypothetical protein
MRLQLVDGQLLLPPLVVQDDQLLGGVGRRPKRVLVKLIGE